MYLPRSLFAVLVLFYTIHIAHFSSTSAQATEFIVNEKKIIELIIFFITFGSFLLLMSYGSGWSKLAQLYKTNQHPPVVLFNNQSGEIGGHSFYDVLTIGVSRQGLYLSNFFNFFNNMPPLLIPWDAVTHVRPDDKILKREAYQLDIGTPTITTLKLPKAALLSVETILEAKQ